jgi:hypothetical protein
MYSSFDEAYQTPGYKPVMGLVNRNQHTIDQNSFKKYSTAPAFCLSGGACEINGSSGAQSEAKSGVKSGTKFVTPSALPNLTAHYKPQEIPCYDGNCFIQRNQNYFAINQETMERTVNAIEHNYICGRIYGPDSQTTPVDNNIGYNLSNLTLSQCDSILSEAFKKSAPSIYTLNMIDLSYNIEVYENIDSGMRLVIDRDNYMRTDVGCYDKFTYEYFVMLGKITNVRDTSASDVRKTFLSEMAIDCAIKKYNLKRVYLGQGNGETMNQAVQMKQKETNSFEVFVSPDNKNRLWLNRNYYYNSNPPKFMIVFNDTQDFQPQWKINEIIQYYGLKRKN